MKNTCSIAEPRMSQELVHYFVKAIELNPNYAAAYNNKGNGLSYCGRYEEALICTIKQ